MMMVVYKSKSDQEALHYYLISRNFRSRDEEMSFYIETNENASLKPRYTPVKNSSNYYPLNFRTLRFHKTVGKDEYFAVVSFRKWVNDLGPIIRNTYKNHPEILILKEAIEFNYDPTHIPLQDKLETFCVDEFGTVIHQSVVDQGKTFYKTRFQMVITTKITKHVFDHFYRKTENMLWPYNKLINAISDECWWVTMVGDIRKWADEKKKKLKERDGQAEFEDSDKLSSDIEEGQILSLSESECNSSSYVKKFKSTHQSA